MEVLGKCREWTLTFLLQVSLMLLSSVRIETTAIMTFPEEGVYSIFPHEDLRTGKRTIRFEDSDRGRGPPGDRYQDSRPPPPPLDLGRDDLPLRPDPPLRPTSGPILVDILRPTSNGLRSLDLDRPLRPDRPNVFRDRGRDHLYFSNRSPRVQFTDDERRVYGYGKKYYHDELPPLLTDEPSRETNLIRPSPIDYNREPNDRAYLPETYSYGPEAKLPPGARDRDSGERTRVHIFHAGDARRNYHGYRHPDGPVKVDVPGSGAFLNHDEYLEFHTKLALDTLTKEKKKLEEAQKRLEESRKKFANNDPPSPRPMMKVDGLVPPPNFDKKVTIIQEDHISEGEAGSSCEDHSGGNSIGSTRGPMGSNNEDQERNKFNPGTSPGSLTGNRERASSTPTSFFSTNVEYGNSGGSMGKDSTDKSLLVPSTTTTTTRTSSTETGFLPIVPFHLQGSKTPTATVIKIDESRNRLSPSYNPSTDSSFKGSVTPVQNPLRTTTTTPPTQFNLPPPTPLTPTSFNLEITRNKTISTTTARVGSKDIAKVKFQQRPPTSLLTLAPQSTSTPSNINFGEKNHPQDGNNLESATETVMNQPVSSPSIFIDSQEVNGFYNGTGPNPRDKMMIYVERVKSHLNAHRKEGQVSTASSSNNNSTLVTRKTSNSSNSVRSSTSSMSYSSSSKIESLVKIHTSTLTNTNEDLSQNPLNQSLEFITESPALKVTTGNGINSGVVSKVHAHISHCPKLYGPVEIICDVHVRDRHGNPNPFLTVGWVRKFYNDSTPDKLVAVNKTLAYEEEFHDKFNVTLAPGISPMLRSVLIIREVTVKDCGNYECEVFDGVSTHKSETLVFLCH